MTLLTRLSRNKVSSNNKKGITPVVLPSTVSSTSNKHFASTVQVIQEAAKTERRTQTQHKIPTGFRW